MSAPEHGSYPILNSVRFHSSSFFFSQVEINQLFSTYTLYTKLLSNGVFSSLPSHKVLLLAHYPNIFEIFNLSSMAWVARMQTVGEFGVVDFTPY